MPVNEQILSETHDRYGSASWAIWSDSFPDDGCIEEDPNALYTYIAERTQDLTPEVVFLSLNPSTHFPEGFANFHSTSSIHFDRRLKEFIQDADLTRLMGGYMTDLVMDEQNPDSNTVRASDAHLGRFFEQLALLDEPTYHVICFLEQPFNVLRKHFGAKATTLDHNIRSFTADWNGRTIHCYRVWFFGNWGAHQEKVPELREQLRYLNNTVLNE